MRLALGTVQFGLPYGIANQVGQVTRSEAKAMLQLASESGIDTLDTAIGYGESEICLGEAGVRKFKIVTKLPPIPAGCRDISGWVDGQVSVSMDRLGVDELYGLLLHRPEDLLGSNGKLLFRALLGLKDKGQVRKLGVSIYSPHELDAINKLFSVDLVQAPFNLLDQRLHSTGWLDRLKSKGVEIHTRSVFLQGLLLMSQTAVPRQFARWDGLWDRWHKWLAVHNVTAVQACLASPLAFEGIDRVVVGADNLSQLEQLIGTANSAPLGQLPNLRCEEEDLINPSQWPGLPERPDQIARFR